MCRFSFYTAFTISLAPIFRANMPLLHKFSCAERLSLFVSFNFCSTSPCKSVFCSRFPCKHATFLKKHYFCCKCLFIPSENVNFLCLKKGIFLFFCPFFPCKCVTSLPGSLLLSFLLLFSVRICHFYIKNFFEFVAFCVFHPS